MPSTLRYMQLALFTFLFASGCARNNPNKTAIKRWEGCTDLILLLDQELDSIDIQSLPKGDGDFIHYTRTSIATKSVERLNTHKKMLRANCRIDGVRAFPAFKVYELDRFGRRMAEYTGPQTEITERHIMIIGEIEQFEFKAIEGSETERVIQRTQISPKMLYVITQWF